MPVNRRQYLKGAGATITGVSGAGCNIIGGGGGSELTVAMIIPQSGAAGSLGELMENGANIFLDHLQDNDDLLPDTEMETIIKNGESDTEASLSAARELVQQEDVDVITGPALSSVARTVSNFTNNQGVPFLPGGAVDPSITSGENCGEYNFRAYPHTGMSSNASALWAAQNLGEECYMITADYSAGQAVAEVYQKILSENGIEIVENNLLPLGNEQWGGVIDDIKSTDPDWVLFNMSAGGVPTFLTAAANRGLEYPLTGNAFLLAFLGVLSQDQFESLGDIYWDQVLYHADFDTEKNDQFVSDYEAEHGNPPGQSAGIIYGNLDIVAKTFNQAGEISADAFLETASGATYESVFGTVNFRECDHQGAPNVRAGRYTGINSETSRGELELTGDVDPSQFRRPCSEVPCSF